jgi:hypothetical protein
MGFELRSTQNLPPQYFDKKMIYTKVKVVFGLLSVRTS